VTLFLIGIPINLILTFMNLWVGEYLFVAAGTNEAAVWGLPGAGECLKCFRTVPLEASRYYHNALIYFLVSMSPLMIISFNGSNIQATAEPTAHTVHYCFTPASFRAGIAEQLSSKSCPSLKRSTSISI
jgi:hypothetical protein